MVKVKSFSTELKIFHTMKELESLDQQVNQFIKDSKVSKIVSVSDTCTTVNCSLALQSRYAIGNGLVCPGDRVGSERGGHKCILVKIKPQCWRELHTGGERDGETFQGN
jgi:hypothetical protein